VTARQMRPAPERNPTGACRGPDASLGRRMADGCDGRDAMLSHCLLMHQYRLGTRVLEGVQPKELSGELL
jgi:hypothetical protein